MWNDLLADSAFQFFKYQSSVSHHHSDSYDLTAAQGGPAGENLAFGTPSISADKAVHRSGQVRFITRRPKSRTMSLRATRNKRSRANRTNVPK